MSELLSKLTGEQALVILQRLAGDNETMSAAVETAAKSVLDTVDVEEVAEDVLFSLDMIDVEDCWDRAGSSQYGYTSADEAAEELVEEAISSSVDQAERYHDLQMAEQERNTFMGIIFGLYRYEKESTSEFKDWCVDIPRISAGLMLGKWRKRNTDTVAANAMVEFIRNRCPDWSGYLLKL